MHYLYISPLIFFIRLSYNLPVYFVMLYNCSVLSVVSVNNKKNKKIKIQWSKEKDKKMIYKNTTQKTKD
jgi:hypothetical protein